MRILVTSPSKPNSPLAKAKNVATVSLGALQGFQHKSAAQPWTSVTGMGGECPPRSRSSDGRSPYHEKGLAGSLKETHKVGDILCRPRRAANWEIEDARMSRNLYTAAFCDQAVRANMFLTAEAVVATAQEKKRLSPFGTRLRRRAMQPRRGGEICQRLLFAHY
jgi:hypothetical protein